MKLAFLVLFAVLSLAAPAFAQLAIPFKLSWTQVLNPGEKIDGTVIERKGGGVDWQAVQTVGPDVREVTDATVTGGIEYCYRARWLIKDSTGTMTGPDLVIIPAVPPETGNLVFSGPSNEPCATTGGVALAIRPGLQVLLSRRNTTGSVIVSMLANASEPVSSGADPSTGVNIALRESLQLLLSRRATNGSTLLLLLVNKNEVVVVNGKVCMASPCQ